VLKVPISVATPDGDAVFEDVNRLMSTAMAVMALAEYVRKGSAWEDAMTAFVFTAQARNGRAWGAT